MPTLAISDLQQVLGDVDPFTIERILQTGATLDEITEARAELDDRRFEEDRAPRSARVVEVRSILEELIDEDDDDREC